MHRCTDEEHTVQIMQVKIDRTRTRRTRQGDKDSKADTRRTITISAATTNQQAQTTSKEEIAQNSIQKGQLKHSLALLDCPVDHGRAIATFAVTHRISQPKLQYRLSVGRRRALCTHTSTAFATMVLPEEDVKGTITEHAFITYPVRNPVCHVALRSGGHLSHRAVCRCVLSRAVRATQPAASIFAFRSTTSTVDTRVTDGAVSSSSIGYVLLPLLLLCEELPAHWEPPRGTRLQHILVIGHAR